ncbi:MAG: 8-oxoguanine glycosylase protein, partial [Verrucomicrobiales bacterium]|nr:8-oxoguanine glycosylase protein [Verrucomicrobiales bacterium]
EVPQGSPLVQDFPAVQTVARASEQQLRACKMGFRAPNLQKTAILIDSGKIDLESLRSLSVDEAREALVGLPGVGPKIANCVLLFAYGFQSAFPVDVWIMKALTQLYFPRRNPGEKKLAHFAGTHFGPYAGYAQQYLFHYMRTKQIKKS